jgi:fused signal recognition particle receptor
MVFQFLKAGYTALKSALQKSRSFFAQKLASLFATKVDEELIEGLEELFFEADLGLPTAQELIKKTRKFLKEKPKAVPAEIIAFLQEELTQVLLAKNSSLYIPQDASGPTVLLIVGVNGNGKTTSIAKLAHILKNDGKKVLLAGADTFRAGAQEQLAIWADRLQVDLVCANYKSDPAAVAFDAITKAKTKGYDFLLIDTAGRLENKTNLMKELEKIKRSCQKLIPDSPHETLLVMDATVGQNGLEQAKVFNESTPLSGIILTKLDGTARGGTAFAIQQSLQIPIKFISTGETIKDFAPFEPRAFVKALFEE